MIIFPIAFWSTFLQILLALIKIVCLLVAIAYYTLAERKIMASVQRRRGPNVVGFWGLLQPLADGLKLFAKEVVLPAHANKQIFFLAPVLMLTLSLLSWSVIPFYLYEPVNHYSVNSVAFSLFTESNLFTKSTFFTDGVASIPYSLLFLLSISSLNVYGIIMAGWSSNSKYAFLGALRSAAQMISYEVSISLIVLTVIALAGSLDLVQIVFIQSQTIWFIVPLLPSAIVFAVAMLAETNRAPFDLPEAEAELVAGYNVEYSSMIFAMFFLGEYSNMILMSTLGALLFLGGWDTLNCFTNTFGLYAAVLSLALKTSVFCVFFILVRASYPRYRYDQLMDLGWKVFLPVLTGFLIFEFGLLIAFDAFPANVDLYYLGAKLPKNFAYFSINEFTQVNMLQNLFGELRWTIITAITIFFGATITIFVNPIHALLALITVFLFSAVILFSQNLQFLALAFLIIYVGAVAILFLFVLMLFNLNDLIKQQQDWTPLQTQLFIFGMLGSLKLYAVVTKMLFSELVIKQLEATIQSQALSLTKSLLMENNDLFLMATTLYTETGAVFFNSLVGVLLVAMIGALVLALNTSQLTSSK